LTKERADLAQYRYHLFDKLTFLGEVQKLSLFYGYGFVGYKKISIIIKLLVGKPN